MTTKAVPSVVRLLQFEQLPVWMKSNQFIRSGYRPPLRSYGKCLASLGYLHNETGNIYTHLAGVLLFLKLGWLTQSYLSHHIHSVRWADHVVQFTYIAGAVGCLGLSSMYHLFSCHSHPVAQRWNRCDYLGIVLLITASFYPPLYYTFYCRPTLLMVYMTMINCSALGVAYVVLQDRAQHDAFQVIRTALFVTMGLSGVLPLAHGMFQLGMAHTHSQLIMRWLFPMGFFYILGAFLYAAKIPERWWPGKFDYWFHSHQIFHVLVILAAVFHYIGVISIFAWHHSNIPTCMV
ncbi:hypothetical protein IWQ61_009946 [Dispira simplex]|nr:hypothetical protein IWQ61_009946 [Dispira simplex]